MLTVFTLSFALAVPFMEKAHNDTEEEDEIIKLTFIAEISGIFEMLVAGVLPAVVSINWTK